MKLSFSFIIPVYNRPDEVRELLQSCVDQTYTEAFEVVIVEDGSTEPSDTVVATFKEKLAITYLKKENTGPGDSRNYGMHKAQGNYCIILDSDCILPPSYLQVVSQNLGTNFVHCYGGPDAAHPSFSPIQKAINYAMTSLLTTGGIRGRKQALGKFQPRSFNMGISKEAFDATGGFGNIHPGEDPDLSIRLWDLGYNTRLLPEAFVYHKRRINWKKFYTQVNKFGMVRPILSKWHPQTAKLTYWFPTVFCIGFVIAVISALVSNSLYLLLPIGIYLFYFTILFFHAWYQTKRLNIALLALIAVGIQFMGYGYGFLKSTFLVNFSKKQPEQLFPKLFFKP